MGYFFLPVHYFILHLQLNFLGNFLQKQKQKVKQWRMSELQLQGLELISLNIV